MRPKSPSQPTIRTIAETWAAQSRWPTARAVAKEAIAAFGQLKPSQLNALIVGGLVANWRKTLAASTAYGYTSNLKKLLIALREFGSPKIQTPRVPRAQPRATVATGEELYRLLKDPAPWLRLFILLYLQCGLRRSEALAVTPRTWNREEHTVTIPVKGGRTRTAEVTPDVELLFNAAGDPDPDVPFIHTLHGSPITGGGVLSAWHDHRKRAGINPNLNAHDLRRTAATILYTATKDLRVPAQLLGHRNLSSTLIYLAPLAPDEARRYAELLRFDRFHSQVKQ
jgi:integrase